MVRVRQAAILSLLLAVIVIAIFHHRSQQLDASNLAMFQGDMDRVPITDKLNGLLRFDSGASTGMIPMLKELPSTVMPKMGNNTAREQLGRSTWRLLHVMAARYPEKPTQQQREAFEFFVLLLSRLYPCGDCAEHFQQLLKTRKPNVSRSHKRMCVMMCSFQTAKRQFCGCARHTISSTKGLAKRFMTVH